MLIKAESAGREWLGMIAPVEDAHCPSADGVGGLDRHAVAMAVELTGILHQCCQTSCRSFARQFPEGALAYGQAMVRRSPRRSSCQHAKVEVARMITVSANGHRVDRSRVAWLQLHHAR